MSVATLTGATMTAGAGPSLCAATNTGPEPDEKALTTIIAVVSLLHEPADRNSATRLFRDESVLGWTLQKLAAVDRLANVTVLCWDDQRDAAEPIADTFGVKLIVKGPRAIPRLVEAILAARRWSDGWRGGLMATCDFDRGFYGPWVREVADATGADAAIIIDPSASLLDSALLENVISHADAHSKAEICFIPGAPGACGPLLRRALIDRLAAAQVHPGRVLNYHPDVIAREPLSGETCVRVPTAVARTPHRFDLSSDRQVARMSAATLELDGRLPIVDAEELAFFAARNDRPDALPREVVLELTTTRLTRPIFWPGRHMEIHRPELSLETARRLFSELATLDDTRLTLAGVGDPLLASNCFDIIAVAQEAGLAVHVETDLLGPDVETVRRLATSGVDVVSFHLPALTDQMYAAIMGIDGYRRVMENVQTFVAERAKLGRGVPLAVPIFTKCRDNLIEMEPWYDQWLRALGSALVVGPSDYGGQVPDIAVADMAPPRRKPCARLASRLTILSDGQVVSCEQDFLGRQPMGDLSVESLADVWQRRFADLREKHRTGSFASLSVCGPCREWHRP